MGGEHFLLTGVQYRGVRMLQTTRPVRRLSDLSGIRLRTGHMTILHRPWVHLGAAAVPMAFTEIYMGLQQGTIEGQENPLLTSYASGFHEVERFFMNTEHVYGMVGFVWNRAFFESLPREYQDIIRQASNEVAEWRFQVEEEAQEEYIRLFIEAGLEYIMVEDLHEWRRVLEEPLRQDFPFMQDWVARINEFNRLNP
jgi:TRAP-type C4-dicarboxylate transport system substrate-binding protein